MLDSTVTLNFSLDGVGTAADVDFAKRAHEIDNAQYRETNYVADPSLPEHTISFSVTEPKPTPDFYGVRRSNINLRRGFSVPIPGGESEVKLAVIKLSTSIPVGLAGVQISALIDEFVALLSHDVSDRNIRTQEC